MTSNIERYGNLYLAYAFTEEGIAMLAGIPIEVVLCVLQDTTEAKGQPAGVDRVQASCFILPDRLLDRMDLVPENSWIILLLLPPI